MTPQEENFALQIVEFFNVADYEVPGYKLPLSVTSLHTHLWNCAVDYRLVVFFLFLFFFFFFSFFLFIKKTG